MLEGNNREAFNNWRRRATLTLRGRLLFRSRYAFYVLDTLGSTACPIR